MRLLVIEACVVDHQPEVVAVTPWVFVEAVFELSLHGRQVHRPLDDGEVILIDSISIDSVTYLRSDKPEFGGPPDQRAHEKDGRLDGSRSRDAVFESGARARRVRTLSALGLPGALREWS